MWERLAPGLVALCILAPPAAAQYPIDAVGFHFSGAYGNTAGEFCWGFQCAPDGTTVSPGEPSTLVLRGDPSAAYVVGVSATATSCLPIPGLSNGLVLDPPIYVAFAGTLDEFGPILSCPAGQETISFAFPGNAPIGASVGLQAVILPFSAIVPSVFTRAIVLTVA